MERRRSTSDSAEAWSVRRDASRRHERSRQGLGVCELFVHRMENAPNTCLQTRGTTLDHGNGDVFLITAFPSTPFPRSYFLSRKRLHRRRDKRRWNKRKQRSGILMIVDDRRYYSTKIFEKVKEHVIGTTRWNLI